MESSAMDLKMKDRKITMAFLPEEMALRKGKRLTLIIDKDTSLSEIRLTEERDVQKFCTGSKYVGKWNAVGIAESGIYRYPHGVIYEGQFNHNGEFHGAGALIYPNGHRVDALWVNGKLYSQQLTTNNESYADYCRMPDRRFQIEIENDLRPANAEYLINSPNPPKPIPSGFYYTDDGVYGPKFKAIMSFDEGTKDPKAPPTPNFEPTPSYIESDRRSKMNLISKVTESDEKLYRTLRTSVYEQKMKINAIPTKKKERWIVRNCRRAWDKNIGYRPDLYESWTTGVKAEEERLSNILGDRMKKKSEDMHIDESSMSVSNITGDITATNFIQKPRSISGFVRRRSRYIKYSKPEK